MPALVYGRETSVTNERINAAEMARRRKLKQKLDRFLKSSDKKRTLEQITSEVTKRQLNWYHHIIKRQTPNSLLRCAKE